MKKGKKNDLIKKEAEVGTTPEEKNDQEQATGPESQDVSVQNFEEKASHVFRKVILICGVVMFVFSAFSIYMARKKPHTPKRDETEQITPAKETPTEVLPDLKALCEENPDMVGWIKIADTVVDYPVMFTPNDGQYYLYRDFKRQKDINGCIFIDEHGILEPRDTNLLFHGHSMKNGSMFAALLKYKNKDFYEAHKIARFDTLYERGQYEVVSMFRIQPYTDSFKYYTYFDLSDPALFKEFTDGIMRLSMHGTGATFAPGDTFITLSTCDTSIKEGRFVVVAKKVDQ